MRERPAARLSRHRDARAFFLFLAGVTVTLLCIQAAEAGAKPKVKSLPRPEPDLKIVELKVSPTPYMPSESSLDFTVTVQLPKDLNGSTLLEVSSLVNSPSMTSMRFLSSRQPIEAQAPVQPISDNGAAPAPSVNGDQGPRLTLVLSWDGMDQQKRTAPPGLYEYEVRAKLLSVSDKGPRTYMTSWPKRGVLEVK